MVDNFFRSLLAILFTIVTLVGCLESGKKRQAMVKGTITIADSISKNQDYSGTGITIVSRDSANTISDTLFNSSTNANGQFSGMAEFPERRQYMMVISRNGQDLGQTGIILAEDDTLDIKAELPDIGRTLELSSREHKALETYRRVDRNFQRLVAFGRAGQITADSLAGELQNWPNIYWQVYEEHTGTLAAQFAAKKAIELLSQLDRSRMMERIGQIEDNDALVYLAATYGTEYTAQNEGLDEAIRYLQRLESKSGTSTARMRIQMERINLLYDSTRGVQARKALNTFKNEFEDDTIAQEWAASVEYDLNYLSPGDAIPDFSFTDGGETISREELKGTAYLLEITELSNPLYQQQFDRTTVIHSIYKYYDFEIITIPLDTAQASVNAFFENRPRVWPVASADAFNSQELVKTFNIQALPVRFLIDHQGRIVRRFEGSEYRDVIKEIQNTLNIN